MATQYHYVWIKRKNDVGWNYYYYSTGITKEEALEKVENDPSIIDYDLSETDESPWADIV